MKRFFITTAIDYANGKPHIGHAYEKVLADVMARAERLRGREVHFLTGLDEHGQKVQQSALKEGVDPQVFCDECAKEFKNLCSVFSITNDDFIRTTEPRHKTVVSSILQTLFDKGDIYQGTYTGFYSTRQEQFLQEKDRIDGKWPEIFGEVKEITEKNYFFRLGKYQTWLMEFFREHPQWIFPEFRMKQVIEFLKEPLNDLCISRPKERLSWGISLPFDGDYVTYVWFDALINYISAVHFGSQAFSDYWPADFHVIGKDILVPAHAIYWPIMLHALGIALPKRLLVHGWWLRDGDKMSKSLGNALDPVAIAQQFGSDAFRYFVMREMSVGQDGNFSVELLNNRYKNDLGNDLGNLVNRLSNMVTRYANGRIPEAKVVEDKEVALRSLWEKTHQSVLEAFDQLHFHVALERIFHFISAINRYTEERAPWKLAKSSDPSDLLLLQTTLAHMAEGIRLASLLLQPVLPTSTANILQSLNVTDNSWNPNNLLWSSSLVNKTLKSIAILFPKIELA